MKEVPSSDLGRFEMVFADSGAALEAAWEAGLSRSARILTRSPALHLREDVATVLLDERKRVSDAALDAFYFSIQDFIADCHRALRRDPDLSGLAILVARELSVWHQRIVNASLLLDEDFEAPRLVLDVEIEGHAGMRSLRAPWSRLLAPNADARRFEVRLPRTAPAGSEPKAESLWRRYRVRGLAHALWRLAERGWSRLPAHWGRRRLYYVRDSEIVRDVGVRFALRGYRVVRLSLPFSEEVAEGESGALAERALGRLGERLNDRLAGIVPRGAVAPLLDMLREAVAGAFRAYHGTLAALEARNWPPSRPERTLVLTNHPNGGAALALADHGGRRGFVFAGVQHGVTVELVDRPQNLCNLENALCDHALLLSPKAAELLEQSPFRREGSCVAVVGEMRDVRRAGGWRRAARRRQRRGRIIYTQMLGRVGHVFNGAIYQNDFENHVLERRLVREVFACCAHHIVFKPYPAGRYTDADPILDLVQATRNVSLEPTGADLRFLLSDYDGVITVGASSTLMWCLGSDLPVIYVDPLASGHRLSDEVREVFRAGVFYFDARAPDFLPRLATFLNQPMARIADGWEEKARVRQELRAHYFGAIGIPPGREGQRWLARQRIGFGAVERRCGATAEPAPAPAARRASADIPGSAGS